MTDTKPPTAFVSWAHRSAEWADARVEAWRGTVRGFTDALRRAGVDADVDLYHWDDPNVDWTRYGTVSITRAETTIIAISSAWRERWDGTNAPTDGAGAAREADALHGMYDANQQEFQRRVKVVLLPGAEDADVPADLRRATRYYVSEFTSAGMEDLLRALHRSPRYVMPPLGPRPDLPPSAGDRTEVVGGWRPLAVPAPPARTPLDNNRDRFGGPVVELQLLREGPSALARADLRTLAGAYDRRLREAKPSTSIGTQGVSWDVTTDVGSEQATVVVHSRFDGRALDMVTPDHLADVVPLLRLGPMPCPFRTFGRIGTRSPPSWFRSSWVTWSRQPLVAFHWFLARDRRRVADPFAWSPRADARLAW